MLEYLRDQCGLYGSDFEKLSKKGDKWTHGRVAALKDSQAYPDLFGKAVATILQKIIKHNVTGRSIRDYLDKDWKLSGIGLC